MYAKGADARLFTETDAHSGRRTGELQKIPKLPLKPQEYKFRNSQKILRILDHDSQLCGYKKS